ncbi:ABC transporter permease [Promicromonospora panici]|uniref:ABC transporter permease n=1 Tax=Promicromonospora panici TaxID=2219658 RepID=UPI00101BEAD8|nr:ABC transporter permease subunit [Promicromonospora panici]
MSGFSTGPARAGLAAAGRASAAAGTGRALAAGLGRALGTALLMLTVLTVVWVVSVALVDNTFVAKGPAEVYEFLFAADDAAQTRAEIATALGVTLGDAAIGFVAGMLAAIVAAALIVLSRPVETAVMPVALILRAVPLIALTPIIRLLFSDELVRVAVVSGIVVLFPALVNVVQGLRSVSAQMSDVVHVYGGGPLSLLFRVAFPSALPALFASVRISVPGAITGALLAEWLITGKGIGSMVVNAVGRSENNLVWACVLVVTLASLALYLLAQIVESFVLARYGRT